MNIHKKLEMWKNGFLAVLFGASCDTECFNRYVGELKRHSSTVALVPWSWIDRLLLPNRDRISNRNIGFFRRRLQNKEEMETSFTKMCFPVTSSSKESIASGRAALKSGIFRTLVTWELFKVMPDVGYFNLFLDGYISHLYTGDSMNFAPHI